MELKIIRKNEKELLLETRGETVTLTNLLRDELWNRSNVTEAAEIKEHPYLAEPKIWVKVKSGTPQEALRISAEELIEKVKKFKELFKDAIKSK
jgi:DNA-directed RNA polymerase subunit L